MPWTTEELIDGKRGKALSLILPTKGCSYDKCYMCSYSHGVTPQENLLEIVKEGVEQRNIDKVKIFTSGSFLDTQELSEKDQKELFAYLSGTEIEELTIESRPEFVVKERLKELKEILNKPLEVAVGLESANDHVLRYCVNKGFTYEDFLNATDTLSALDIKIKAYVLLKPLFLTEYEAILDAVGTCEKIEDIADVVSINPMSIHKNTLVEYLWYKREYRPPWIWTLVEVLNEISDMDFYSICHPVALGKKRGTHNCGKCDGELRRSIARYSINNKKIEYYHECKEEWEEILKRGW
ncbi:MAG: archaeosine biosynthesis radical SAM protein RaSEA [Euryarchaeota archaeon]|nr:archaeosine biosynthesis radical SAM protein RaSEA [Euryarchaeota archaeon]